MKKIRLLFILFVAVFSCSKEDPLPTTGNIRGKITDAQNSSPLRDVNVEIGGNSYTTGSDGSYFFNDLPERSYTVSVSKSGYIADTKSVMVRADQTALADFVLSKNLPTVEPASVTISTEEGSKSVTLRNTQAEPIGFSTQSSKPWITVSPGSGTIAGNSQTIVSITVAFDQIEFGTFNENIVINVSGSSLNIPVVAVKSQPSFINILQPEEDGVYAPEEIMPIRWESNLGGAVDINLLKTGNSSIFRIIQESVSNSNGGNYNWTLPEIEQGFYRVQVVSKENVSVSDITGNFFIGNDPSIPFIERDQEFSYVEDQEAGFVIGTLSASDDLGIESFEFVSGNSAGYFAISNAGKLTLTSQGVESPANDYEQTPNEFTLSVKAIDADGNESVSTSIVIKVVDFDDQPPVVEVNQSFTYSEGRPANFVLGKIEAIDDVGIAAFNIVSGNDQGYFTINGLGELRLTTAGLTSPANDYEQAPNAFTIAVTAADQSGNVSEAVSMNIIVVDGDENPPSIEPNQSFSYLERQAANHEIGTVAATDDVGVTDYEIISGNSQGYFAISSTGVLTLTSTGAALDAASNDFEIQPNEFSLTVIARDNANNLSSQTQILIRILDVDDDSFSGTFFKDSNGITIKCEQCNPGDRGSIDGVIYTAVSEEMLREMVANNEDVTKVVTSMVTDMNALFNEKTSFNQDISSWDVSKVTNMAGMFNDANAFNSDISNWDTSSVTNMEVMFRRATLFNSNISRWDVSRVTSMRLMFADADFFDQPIGAWNVSKVTNMLAMFSGADIFNQDLSDWDVSNVTTMGEMFSGAITFNKPLNTWNVSKVYYLGEMFRNAVSFNQPIGFWDTSSVTTMQQMFDGASSFNQNISLWNTSKVVSMSWMFANASEFDQPIGSWDTSNVERIEYMFAGASSFNRNINDWNIINVGELKWMFYQAEEFNQPLNNWDVSNVSDMTSMFHFANNFDQNLNQWCVKNIDEQPENFAFGSALSSENYPVWGSCPAEYAGNFSLASNGVTIVCTDCEPGDRGVINGKEYVAVDEPMLREMKLYNEDMSSVVTTLVRNMDYLFEKDPTNPDIKSWDVSNVVSMFALFDGTRNFNQNISYWDVSKVVDMDFMFRNAESFNQDISNWCVTNITEEPFNFASGTSILQNSYKPNWGSCGENEVTAQDFILIGSYEGSNYYYLDQNKTFFEAKELADQFGADLLTITSLEEQQYIAQVIRDRGLAGTVWLGLTDVEEEGVWKWLNGESFSYSNWSPGEPNNVNNEDYANLIGGSFLWNDWPGNTQIRVILEFR